MSFIGAVKKGKKYHPGWFLAHEECVRKTQEMTQAMATTTDEGAKYVPMGTVWPSNDGDARGIVYEDVDVTEGNMPGSVVMSGVVYEDRLAVMGMTHSVVTPETGDNPKEKGWYERSGSAGAYVYTLTTDTSVGSNKTYYSGTETRMSAAAKTALQGLGFTFKTVPAVTRPDFGSNSNS